ncbi:MAG TPA: class I SAM-dependent methyltransferase [Spirochaetota bacterium]|nr:class I SAM-dependent methyltransferase [Spirochaetota bacterium]
MEPYTDLARSYDHILNHVDYDQWYRYLRTIMFQYIEYPEWILEMGCGTGKFGAMFSRDDFPVYGMDRSVEMLRVAKRRSYKNFRIFCADMTDFRVSRTFDFLFSVHDTMNYFLTYANVQKVLRSARRAMHDGSIFMFDITTEYNIRRYFDGRVTRHRTRGTMVEWSNSYDEDRKIIRSTLEFRHRDGTRSVEEHLQRIYSIPEIKALLERERLRVVDIFGDYTFSAPCDDTVMINFITRRA